MASVGISYAETEEVPFDASEYNPETEDCFEMGNNWFCKWGKYPPVETEPGVQDTKPVEDDPEVEPLVCPDRFYPNEDNTECIYDKPTVVVDTPAQEEFLKQLETIIQKYEDDPPVGPSEKEEYALVQQLASCARGVGSATGVQQQDRFVVSTTWINEAEEYLVAIDLTGPHSVLRKAIEECQAQKTILEPVVLGREYIDRVNDQANYPTYYHGLRPEVKALDVNPTQRLGERDFLKTHEEAEEALCNNHLYGDDTKLSYEFCPRDTLEVEGGSVSYHSSAYHKYQMHKTKVWGVNTSVIAKYEGSSPISEFITSQGGYEQAREAINWQEHFDATDKHSHDE